ncbi:MAG: glycosyltransferase [Chromatiales bacterium]|nr:glycosyltransferase [Chromatiales bacterium]
MNTHDIAVNIVTYNRRELLMRCLNAVLAQTLPVRAIFLIDNASTDDTPQALQAAGFVDALPQPADLPVCVSRSIPVPARPECSVVFHYVRMPGNAGGAAGQQEGIRRAFEAGHARVWVMDDDGFPAPDCLAVLHAVSEEGYGFSAPLVVDVDRPDRLSFSLCDHADGRIIRRVDEATRRLYPDEANLFNGLLLTREAIERVGYPDPRMFIWGEEVEYFRRAQKAGIRIATAPAARFLHPASKVTYRFGHFGKPAIFHASSLNMYCYYRNHAHIHLRYDGISRLLRFVGLDFVKRLMFLDMKGLRLMTTAVIDALIGRWGREHRYLPTNVKRRRS